MSKVISKKHTTPLKQTPAGNSANNSPLRSSSKLNSRKPSISKTTTRIESSSSKTSIVDKSQRAETSSLPATNRMTPKTLIDNLLCGLISESSLDFGNLHTSDFYHITEAAQENIKENKSGDELIDLREELRKKNILIEQLKKENSGLRKEIGEFLAITDKIQINLEEERRSYEVRISALEQENKDLIAENRFYRDQTHSRFKHRSSMGQLPLADSVVLNDVSGYKGNCNENKFDDMKGGCYTLGDKLVTFSLSKDELQGLTHNFQVEKNWIKENTPSTCRNLKSNEQKTPKKGLYTKKENNSLKLSASPNTKSRTSLHSARGSMSSLHKGIGYESESKIALETTGDKRSSTLISGRSKI